MGDSVDLAGLPAWMINLDRSTGRRDRMMQHIAALGAPFTIERFPAVDGRERASEFETRLDRKRFRRWIGRDMLPGEIGCYFSHLALWETLAATEAPVGLIMEDDIVFHDDFLPALAAALECRSEWDMLKLNHIRTKQPILRRRIGRWRLNTYLGPATGTGAYLIRRDLAARLSAALRVMRLPIDHKVARFDLHDFRLCGLEPFPSHVDDGGDSTITGRTFSEVGKAHPLLRLPSYAWRLSGFWGRMRWLLSHRRR